MIPYECQRSRSFSDLKVTRIECPSIFSNIFSETTGPIQVRFYIENLCLTEQKFMREFDHVLRLTVVLTKL